MTVEFKLKDGEWVYIRDGNPVRLVVSEMGDSVFVLQNKGELSNIDPAGCQKAKAEFIAAEKARAIANATKALQAAASEESRIKAQEAMEQAQALSEKDVWDSKKLAFFLDQDGEMIVTAIANFSTTMKAKRDKTGIEVSGINAMVLCRSQDGEMKVLIGTRDIGTANSYGNKKVAQVICGYFDGDEKQMEYIAQLQREGRSINEFVFNEAAREMDEEILEGLSSHITRAHMAGYIIHKVDSEALRASGVSPENVPGYFPVFILEGITCEEIDARRLKNPPKDFHEMHHTKWHSLSKVPDIIDSGEVSMAIGCDIAVERTPGFQGITKGVKATRLPDDRFEKRQIMSENRLALRAMLESAALDYSAQQLRNERKFLSTNDGVEEEDLKIELKPKDLERQRIRAALRKADMPSAQPQAASATAASQSLQIGGRS